VGAIIAVMRAAGDAPDGVRLRGVIVVLWRAGLRISEALALNETHLDPDRGALVIRHGKGEKRREVGMDQWAWSHLEPWLEVRRTLPVGRLFCVVRGPTRGRPCASAGIREQLHHAAVAAGVRRRFAPGRINCDTRTPLRCRVRGSRWPCRGLAHLRQRTGRAPAGAWEDAPGRRCDRRVEDRGL
jgi:site-specific recombinase XerC